MGRIPDEPSGNGLDGVLDSVGGGGSRTTCTPSAAAFSISEIVLLTLPSRSSQTGSAWTAPTRMLTFAADIIVVVMLTRSESLLSFAVFQECFKEEEK